MTTTLDGDIAKYIDFLRGKKKVEEGGRGSGNFGHAGRPGKVGGSAPGRARSERVANKIDNVAKRIVDLPREEKHIVAVSGTLAHTGGANEGEVVDVLKGNESRVSAPSGKLHLLVGNEVIHNHPGAVTALSDSDYASAFASGVSGYHMVTRFRGKIRLFSMYEPSGGWPTLSKWEESKRKARLSLVRSKKRVPGEPPTISSEEVRRSLRDAMADLGIGYEERVMREVSSSREISEGGKGSGHHGHSGRKGKRGGSSPGGFIKRLLGKKEEPKKKVSRARKTTPKKGRMPKAEMKKKAQPFVGHLGRLGYDPKISTPKDGLMFVNIKAPLKALDFVGQRAASDAKKVFSGANVTWRKNRNLTGVNVRVDYGVKAFAG